MTSVFHSSKGKRIDKTRQPSPWSSVVALAKSTDLVELPTPTVQRVTTDRTHVLVLT